MRWIKWIALAVLLLALSLTAGWLAGVWYDNWQTLQEDCRRMEAELEASREEISRLQEQIFLLEQEAAEKETEKETDRNRDTGASARLCSVYRLWRQGR